MAFFRDLLTENDRLIAEIERLEAAACRAVDAAEDADDGMVLIKWDEFIPLRDAVHNLRAGEGNW